MQTITVHTFQNQPMTAGVSCSVMFHCVCERYVAIDIEMYIDDV